jgi:GNAT superfamily N-acetyltransferase
MTVVSDTDLYLRGMETVVACWEAFARGTIGACLQRLLGVAIAVFPSEPQRAVYNNAVLKPGLAAAERADALDATEGTYAAAGVTRFAAWVHESDEPMRRELERRGYTLDTTTRAMAMSLDDIGRARPEIELGAPEWREHLRIIGMPPDLLSGADQRAFHLLLARLDGENVATALAFDRDGDRGIYNVGTLERARRRGLATALTAILVHDAFARGCQTASLQSTPIAERLYAGLGFRDFGRILEYVPHGGAR